MGKGVKLGPPFKLTGPAGCHRRGFGVVCWASEIDAVALGPLGCSSQASQETLLTMV